MAAVVSQAVGELIDHVSSVQHDARHDPRQGESLASARTSDATAHKRWPYDVFVGVTVLALVLTIVAGIFILLLR